MTKHHSGRELKMETMISEFGTKKTYQRSNALVSAFSFECKEFIPKNLAQSESDVLSRLSSKAMKNGHLEELLKNKCFRQWMRLSVGTPAGKWFIHLLDEAMDDDCSQQFENACISVHNKMFEFTVKSMTKKDK